LSYIRRHWRGELPLAQAFWINLVLVRIVLFYADRLFQPPFAPRLDAVLPEAIAFFAINVLLILPWQVVGVVRATDRLLKEPGTSGIVLGAQIGIVVSLLATGVSVYATFQRLFVDVPDDPYYVTWERDRADRYEIALSGDGKLLRITGDLELGLTKRLRAELAANPGIEGLVLDSGGGFVVQGRAIARLLAENGLDAYVFGRCESSCTIALAGGAHRFIGPGARIGFHQYLYDAKTAHPTIDYEEEYARDRAFFEERGIDPAFLERIFMEAHSSIWYPEDAELIDAGVVEGVVDPPMGEAGAFTPR